MAKRRNPLTGLVSYLDPKPDAASSVVSGISTRSRQTKAVRSDRQRAARRGVSNAAPAPTNLRNQKIPYTRGKIATGTPPAAPSSDKSPVRNTPTPAAAAIRRQLGSGRPSSSTAGTSSVSSSSSSAPSKTSATPALIVQKAQKAKVQTDSFDKATLNRAVSRFVRTHKWARMPGQEDAVRKAAAYLLSKENPYYNAPAGGRKKKKATTSMGGPDRPPAGS